MAYTLTRDALKLDLYAAYHMAKRHKSRKHYVRVFERKLDENLQEICDALFRSINSMLGVMSHFNSYRLKQKLFCIERFTKYGYFSNDLTTYTLHR